MAGEDKRTWQEQRKALLPGLAAQAMLALLVIAGVLYGGYYLCDSIPTPKSPALEGKMTYLIRCCVYPCVLVLCWSILVVSNKRGSTPAVNPLAGKEHLLQLEKNILMNTVEQSLLFLMICLVLATYLEGSELRILPLYSILWVTGRISFTIGYRVNPKYRTFGMATTFIPGLFFLGVIPYLIYTRGFMYGVETEMIGDAGLSAGASKEEL